MVFKSHLQTSNTLGTVYSFLPFSFLHSTHYILIHYRFYSRRGLSFSSCWNVSFTREQFLPLGDTDHPWQKLDILASEGCRTTNGDLKQQNVFSYVSGGRKSKTKVLVGPHLPLQALGKKLSLSFCWLPVAAGNLGHIWCPLGDSHITPVSASIMSSSLCVCLLVLSLSASLL